VALAVLVVAVLVAAVVVILVPLVLQIQAEVVVALPRTLGLETAALVVQES
jgi:hypothetical protein